MKSAHDMASSTGSDVTACSRSQFVLVTGRLLLPRVLVEVIAGIACLWHNHSLFATYQVVIEVPSFRPSFKPLLGKPPGVLLECNHSSGSARNLAKVYTQPGESMHDCAHAADFS